MVPPKIRIGRFETKPATIQLIELEHDGRDIRDIITEYRTAGMTWGDIAGRFGVDRATLAYWRHRLGIYSDGRHERQSTGTTTRDPLAG